MITSNAKYKQIVEKQIKSASNDIGRFPAAHCNWMKLLNFENYSSQIVLTGNSINDFIKLINSEFMPTTTFGFNNGNKSFFISDDKYVEDKNLAYYCKDYHCELPVEKSEDLLKQISNLFDGN